MIHQRNKVYLITSALPYANGPLHLGHMLSYTMADILKRFFSQHKDMTCFHICGSDMHGTPIMISSHQQKQSPADWAQFYEKKHREAFAGFGINFDVYQSTNHCCNKDLVNNIFQTIKKDQGIFVTTCLQAFDKEKKVFLPDRFLQSFCPECDQEVVLEENTCPRCKKHYLLGGAKYRSLLSETTPQFIEVKQYALALSKIKHDIASWNETLPTEYKYVFTQWYNRGLQDWIISRSAPYWGLEIYNSQHTIGKRYFYVWFEAPIGYLAATKSLARLHEKEWQSFWNEAQIYQFIGKDILHFHTVFWPAILHYIHLKKPDHLIVNGHLTLQGKKLSKSTGHSIDALHFLQHYPADYFRYYAAKKMHPGKDLDISCIDLCHTINNCLISKILNIASRLNPLIQRYDNVVLGSISSDKLQRLIRENNIQINHFYLQCKNYEVVAISITAATELNRYINMTTPWDATPNTHRHISDIMQCFRIIIGWLQPIIPGIAEKVASYYGIEFQHDNMGKSISHNFSLKRYEILAKNIDLDIMKKQMNIEL